MFHGHSLREFPNAILRYSVVEELPRGISTTKGTVPLGTHRSLERSMDYTRNHPQPTGFDQENIGREREGGRAAGRWII